MQMLARERWSKRARALGLLDDEDIDPLAATTAAETRAVVTNSSTGTAQQQVRGNTRDLAAEPDAVDPKDER
jgi:hypothetical protein